MKNIKPVSRWISIKYKDVTVKSALYIFGDDDGDDNKRTVCYFRYRNRDYALNQFVSRYNAAWGCDVQCADYPPFIAGYDSTDYYDPLLCAIDDRAGKIRLYTVVSPDTYKQ